MGSSGDVIMIDKINQAVENINSAHRIAAFTGAGISVESGIPPFRGPGGLWSKYDPYILDIGYFTSQPREAWIIIKELFFDFFIDIKPNAAHLALAEMEKMGKLDIVITQNIDNMHQEAGNTEVIEYHGNSRRLVCLSCGSYAQVTEEIFTELPPLCKICGGILKPDFVFFGEPIPPEAQKRSAEETRRADVWIVVGTTGEVYPAASLPGDAKRNGKYIVEVNTNPSEYTGDITDVFLQGKATEMLSLIAAGLGSSRA